MPAHDPARRFLALTVLASVLALGPAGRGPAAAVEAIPDETVHSLEARTTFAAIVGDVDGDGQRELIRLVPWSTNPGQLAVEVVSAGPDGAPRSHGDALVERAASPEDTFEGRNPEEEPLLPMSSREPARLLAWTDAGRERVLLASIGIAELDRPCCLTLWHVGLDAHGATILRPLRDTSLSSAWIRVADLDADGTDELVVLETPDPADPTNLRAAVLRWNGTDFDRLFADLPGGRNTGPLQRLGDSDGRPGEEVGFIGLPRFDATRPALFRLSLSDGEARAEVTLLPAEGELLPIAGPDGGRLALVNRLQVELLDWPAGAEEPLSERTSLRGGSALGALGRGEDALLLVLRGPAIDVLDASLVARQGVFGGEAAIQFGPTAPQPFLGALPGGTASSEEALIFRGQLLTPPTPGEGASGLAVSDMALLPGMAPVGLVGVSGEWAAVAADAALDTQRDGGPFALSERADRVAFVRSEDLFSPEADGGRLDPPLDGAVRDDRQLVRPILLTSDGVRAEVAAPAGSRVLVETDDRNAHEELVGASGRASVQLQPPGTTRAHGQRHLVRLVVITPAGHGYGASWEVRVVRQPPELELSVPFAPLSFSVEIRGRTEPTAEVTIDGRAVDVGPDGTFAASVGAGFLPRSVAAQAVDRLGNVREERVSVVGFVDYRQLPWIPIVAVLLLLTMLLLYLRVPRPAATPPPRPSADEGTFEELP